MSEDLGDQDVSGAINQDPGKKTDQPKAKKSKKKKSTKKDKGLFGGGLKKGFLFGGGGSKSKSKKKKSKNKGKGKSTKIQDEPEMIKPKKPGCKDFEDFGMVVIDGS